MTFKEIAIEIYDKLKGFNTFLYPLIENENNNIDYANNVYVTYKIGNSEDISYKTYEDLEIQVISNYNNQIEANEIATEIDKIISKSVLKFGRITRKNIYKNSVIDYETGNIYITLMYNINNYKE